MLFSFEGRIGRKTYWIAGLVILVGTIIAGAVDMAVMGESVGFTSMLFALIVLWPSLALQAKRWHDRDKSGWWTLINLIPIVGPIWALIENGFLPGTEGGNRFGDNP